jgi:hypothetical protein
MSRKPPQAKLVAASVRNPLTLTCEGDVDIEAAAGEESLPRFTMVAYTGQPMRPGGWHAEAPIILDIGGMQKPPGGRMPIHRGHDSNRIVGHSESVQGGTKVLVKGVISANNEHAAEVVGSSRNQFPWQASVGARLIGQPEYVSEGRSVLVNGQRHKGPVYVARKWALNEASFVSLGADGATSAIAAEDNRMTFESWIEARGFDVAQLNDAQVETLRAAYAAEQAAQAPAPAPAPVAVAAQPAIDSSAMQAAITSAVQAAAQAAASRTTLISTVLGSHPQLAAQAASENWDEIRIKNEGELARLRANASSGPHIHVSQRSEGAQAQKQIEAAMFIAGGIGNENDAVRTYGEQTVEAAARNLPRAAGLRYLIHETIRASGKTAHPGVMDDDTIRAAFQADRDLRASSGFSTLSLSGTLSNLANKMLLRAYNEVPSVVRRFCRTVPHSDFKAHTKYRVTTPGELDKLGPTGEIKHTELDEDTYSNQIETFARMMALTRQMMRNDDLGAFLQIPAMFGRMAARTHEKSVFSVLLDNTDNFFNASPSAGSGFKSNALASGSSSALSVTSLASAETLFWSQEDKHGNPIDLVPSILLVAPAKYRDATNLLTRTTVTVAGDPTTGKQMEIGNEFVGQFEPVMSPYVSAASLTGNSTTKWWLFAAPSADVAVIEIAYLDGRQAPTIESAETDFNTLGMQWRAYWDWGVAKQDRRAGVYSPGA